MAMCMIDEQRRGARVPWNGGVVYESGPGDKSLGSWRDISYSGASVSLGRYLRPGRYVMLVSDFPFVASGAVELKARVVWCRPTGRDCRFLAGLRIFHDEFDAALAYALLVDHATNEVADAVPAMA
ncbi:MAG TPA: PilZ domain-containing protein [Candidatus Hydrogenedentes bacterium]|nr:PilZ domain-containing protein [Candidatus Hydrogenedentota bacterium]